jgi:hypothetical protein
MKKAIFYIAAIVVAVTSVKAFAKHNPKVEPSFAWTMSQPLGLHYLSSIDTLQYNYQRQAVPSLVSSAYATTGNLGAEGQEQIFFQRQPMSEFFFEDALSAWLPSIASQTYYNTRIPMTLLSYNTGGNKYSNQDRLSGVFSGNVNKHLEIGAAMDYLYSKGSYDYQSDKDFTWRVFGSYIGDRYELQTFFNNYSFLNKESGGITDDRYITDPAQVQGGSTSVDPKTIPTNLTAAHSKVKGMEFYMNHRYKVGFYHIVRDSIKPDSIIQKTYIPVTSFIWTMDYKTNKHMFLNTSANEDTAFFDNTYLKLGGTDDETQLSKLTNTVGISMLEGFNKYAKFGLAAYATYEIRKYTQTIDTISSADASSLTAIPAGVSMPHTTTQNVAWIGGQLTKQHGSILTYNATAQFGVLGDVSGDFSITGDLATRIKLLGDSVKLTAYGYLKNEATPYFIRNYVSNHFIWQNDFGKVRRFRVGGKLDLPFSGTSLNAGYETLQNYVYFGSDGKPVQTDGMIHVLSATVNQNLRAGILNWNNSVTYQTTSNSTAIPLPKLAVYSNLFLQFKIAHAMDVQVGVDCNYYTKYYAPAYNPATMTFHSQSEKECGNFAFMNAYATMKLRQARFFVMFSHVNQGIFGGDDYFAVPHYPLNPRKFQVGVSVDFSD